MVAKEEFTNTSIVVSSLKATNSSSALVVSTAGTLSTTLKAFTSGLPKVSRISSLRTALSEIKTSGAKDSSAKYNVAPNPARTSWRSELRTNLTSLDVSIAALPNASRIAGMMMSLNASLSLLSEDLDTMRAVLESLNARRAGMPTGVLVSSQIDALVGHLEREYVAEVTRRRNTMK